MENLDLGKTQITNEIRVSSAAIFYEYNSWGGSYWQYETFIFSNNKDKFKTRMFIWGTSIGETSSEKMKVITRRAHDRISKVMLSKQWE